MQAYLTVCQIGRREHGRAGRVHRRPQQEVGGICGLIAQTFAAVTVVAIGFAMPAWGESRPITMAEARATMLYEHGGGNFWMVAAERLEGILDSDDEAVWDMSAWYGGDVHRLRINSEGEFADGWNGHGDVELLYSRATTAFWDLQLGVRRSLGDEPGRHWAAFGIAGVAPYWLETDISVYVGGNGASFATMELEHELLVTQNFALRSRGEWGVRIAGSDFEAPGNELALGLRLAYIGNRQLAPYVGFEWSREDDENRTTVVAGLSLWF